MFARFDSAQRVAVSLVGAIMVAAMFVGVAVPVMPIA